MGIPDIRFEDHGTIWLIRGKTSAGEEWLAENVQAETFFGGAIVAEHRFVSDIIAGAQAEGLVVDLA